MNRLLALGLLVLLIFSAGAAMAAPEPNRGTDISRERVSDKALDAANPNAAFLRLGLQRPPDQIIKVDDGNSSLTTVKGN